MEDRGTLGDERPMATHKWEEIRKTIPRERLDRIDEAVQQEVVELNLRALREMVGKTQSEVANIAGMTQGELSRAERRSDHMLSTLRKIVEALGGEVEIRAVFGDKTVRLHGV